MENDIEDFISAIQQKNYNQAKDHFDSLLSDKMNFALEQEKVKVASDIFNGGSEEEEEFEIEDEELEFEDEDEEFEFEDEDEDI